MKQLRILLCCMSLALLSACSSPPDYAVNKDSPPEEQVLSQDFEMELDATMAELKMTTNPEMVEENGVVRVLLQESSGTDYLVHRSNGLQRIRTQQPTVKDYVCSQLEEQKIWYRAHAIPGGDGMWVIDYWPPLFVPDIEELEG